MQIYPEVTTQKILLVGHSQGSFYANELYRYLIAHGVPRESIGVYAIATPASYVEGAGEYVTSTNDKAINWIRDHERGANNEVYANSHYLINDVVATPLRANITVPKETEWALDDFGGHHFSVYMQGAGERIASDIESELSKLKATGANSEQCFVPPESDTAYKLKAAAFSVFDPLSKPVAGAALGTWHIGTGTYHALASALTSTRGALADSRGLLAGTRGALAALVSTVDAGSQISVATLSVAPELASKSESTPSSEKESDTSKTPLAAQTQITEQPQEQEQEPLNTENATTTSEPEQEAAPTVPLFRVASPGFGGGGGAPKEIPTQQQNVSSAFTVDAPAEGALLSSHEVRFSGTSDPDAEVAAGASGTTATSTADASGAWSFLITLPEGTSIVAVSTDGASESRTVTVDTVPPATTTLSAAECALSLNPDFCAVPNDSVSLTWTAVGDAAAYGIVRDGSLDATTTTTSVAGSLAAGATTTFAVVAFDAAGNAATSSEISVYVVSQPLLINEIAWAGDTTNDANQWIELKNIAPFDVDLSHISIERSGGDPITLSGTIHAAMSSNYLVVEPFEIPFTGADKLVTPYAALATTTAEQLSLVWNGAAIDQTPAVDACSGWCAGALNSEIGHSEQAHHLFSPLSMERIDLDGTLPSSWQSTDSYGPWSGSGGATWGTPGMRNSDGIPEAAVNCASGSGLLTEENSSGPFDTGSGGCVYFSRFITPGGAKRWGTLFRGTVGSSTSLGGNSFGKSSVDFTSDKVPDDATPGEDFFFAMWESRVFSFGSQDTFLFTRYFEQGASTTLDYRPPHGNYVVLPFIYQPE